MSILLGSRRRAGEHIDYWVYIVSIRLQTCKPAPRKGLVAGRRGDGAEKIAAAQSQSSVPR